MGGTRKEETARQLRLPISYKDALQRVDRAFANFNTLMYHLSDTHNDDAVEYWSGRVVDSLVRLSFDLQEAAMIQEEDSHGQRAQA